MNIKSLFQFVIYMCIIEGIMLDNEWIKPTKNESAVVGCSVQLAWELFGDLDVSIYKVSGQEHIKDVMLNDSEKYQLSRINELQYLTINNISTNDAGVYRCKGDYFFADLADINLTVTDIKWLNTTSIHNLSVGDNATVMWKYITNNLDKHISVVRRLNSTQDSVEVLGKLEHDILQYKRNHPRIEIGITESDDGRTEVLMLTIHNTTIDDLNYIYNTKIQFDHNCVKYGEPVSLNEVPRVYSKMPKMIGRPTEDITIEWQYHYSYPVKSVVFNTKTSGQSQQVGYWNGTRFYSYIGEDKLLFSKTSVSSGQGFSITITHTTPDDFNTTYGCNITFSDGVAGYNETELVCDQGPRLGTGVNYQHGNLGDNIMLYWVYTYCPEATDIRFFRTNNSGKSFLIGHWIKNHGYQPIGNNRAVFYQSTVEGKEKITLVILNTDENDYNSTYTCEVIFEDISRNLTAIELILIPDTDIKSGSLFELNLVLMTVLLILAVLICALVGLGIYEYKRKANRVVNTSSNPANNMRHSYISLNSVVIFHANRDSTTTSAESTASNGTDDDTDAYANPYDPINRAGIDTSKNVYMSLQNPGTSNNNQNGDVQEINVDSNSVTNIDRAQIADRDDDDDNDDDDDDTSAHDDDDDDDDDTSAHDSNPYDALNKYTMNSDIHSYIWLPPCTRSVDDVIIVKKRPSTI